MMDGLEELLLCGASLYAVGFYNKKAFFDVLPEQACITYNEVGKWFFSEKISETIAYISFYASRYGLGSTPRPQGSQRGRSVPDKACRSSQRCADHWLG